MTHLPPEHRHRLRLHRQHPCSVAFFDETGAISSDRIFVVGLLRVENHSALLRQVKNLRQTHQFFDEFKWSGITGANEEVYRELFGVLLASPAKFSAFVADRHVADPVSRFGDTFKAYEKLATQLLIGSITPYEIVSVLADNYSAPNTRSFEQTVKGECNWRLKRLAVANVVQVDSKATEGLQLVDVLTGAVGHSFRILTGDASATSRKGQMAAYLRRRLGNANFNNGYKSAEFMVKLYEHEKWLRQRHAALTLGHPPTSSAGTADVTTS